ncbi:unnamed protein product [Owenia fusiformis]|uniref:Uncharacterized protein n=1 Tax=Owenia fusiformis TaxID=6347 RepID=A0A8J1THF5_OWEFU|nr:unnamed protein product [Owenia fusiformis]
MLSYYLGIELSDSLIISPHKGLNLPWGSCALLVKHGAYLHAAMTLDFQGNCLADTQHDHYSPSEYSLELSRPFRALPLWLTLRLLGTSHFEDCIREKMALTMFCYEELKKIPDIEVGPVPELSTVAFQLKSKDNKGLDELLTKINQDGRLFLSSTKIDGELYIRLNLNSISTHTAHAKKALKIIKEFLNRS